MTSFLNALKGQIFEMSFIVMEILKYICKVTDQNSKLTIYVNLSHLNFEFVNTVNFMSN